MTTAQRRLLLAVALVVHVAVLYAPSVPTGGPAGVPGADKVGHAAVFAFLVFAALWAHLPVRWVVGLTLLHAVGSELVQHLLLPGRSGDVWDAVADVVGIGLGWGAAEMVRRRRAAREPSAPDR